MFSTVSPSSFSIFVGFLLGLLGLGLVLAGRLNPSDLPLLLGTGNNANTGGKEGTEKGKTAHKKATKASQIKTSQSKGDKPNKDK